MPEFFNFATPPFDRLTTREQEKFGSALDIGYYAKGEVILAPGIAPKHLYILIKGLVHEDRDEETVSFYAAQDSFDAQAITSGISNSRFTAEEESIAYLLPQKLFLELINGNASFAAFFSQKLNDKVVAQNARINRAAVAPLMATPIGRAYLHPPLFIDAEAPMTLAAELMKEKKATSLLVDHKGTIGLLNSARLRDAALVRRLPIDTPVGEVALYEPITAQVEDPLSHALLLMVKHQIKRILVYDGDVPAGILNVTDLLGFISNRTYLSLVRVARAETIDELQEAAHELPELVRTLYENGSRISHITRQVSEANQRIFSKLFELLAPEELQQNSCLVVMGSEGRHEQILRTDQDNALIVRDGFDMQLAHQFAARFSAALSQFGFPPCPGNMMVSSPNWTKEESAFRTTIHDWIHHPREECMIELAAFSDAVEVAGDRALLRRCKDYLQQATASRDAFFSYFANPINSFNVPLDIFHRLIVERGEHDGELDIKKGGIFPIVHGARSLALRHKIFTTNTLRRLRAIQAMGILDADFTDNLVDAYEFLLGLKLSAGLASPAASPEGNNFIRAVDLSKFEKDLLKDSFQLVKEFRNLVSHHFNLGHF